MYATTSGNPQKRDKEEIESQASHDTNANSCSVVDLSKDHP